MPLRFDVATGGTSLDAVDVRLSGLMPYQLVRRYDSARGEVGALGVGWQYGWDVRLEVSSEKVVCRGGMLNGVEFAAMPPGREARQEESGFVLQHHADAYVLYASPARQLVFPKAALRRDTIPVGAVRDGAGNALRLDYQGTRLAAVTDPDGRRLSFTYTGDRVSGIGIEVGGTATPIRSFTYTMRGELASATDSAGNTSRYSYDGGLLVEVVHASGAKQWAQYDDGRRCIALWSSAGDVIHAHHDPLRQLSRVVDGAGEQTLFQHILGRQVLERIAHAGHSQNYYYDEIERLIGFSQENGDVAVFQRHDPAEQKISLLDREERVALLYLDEGNDVVGVEDAFEDRFVVRRDDRALPVVLVTPTGAEWRFERDRVGRIVKLSSPLGRVLDVRWSRRERIVEDRSGAIARDSFDGFGRLVQHVDPIGRVWRRAYDADGRLVRAGLEGGYSIEFGYGPDGRLALTADSERHRVRLARDMRGLVTGADIDGTRIDLRHDATGRLIIAATPDRRLSISYDPFGRLVSVVPENGLRTAYRYDESSTLVTTGAGTRTYNASRELLASEGEGASEAFTYGPSGELLVYEQKRPGIERTVIFDFDPDGNPRSVSLIGEEEPVDLSFAFDAEGGLTGIELEGSAVGFERDARGLIHRLEVAGEEVAVTSDAAYRITQLRVGDERVAIDYDAIDRPTTAEAPGGAPVDLRHGPSGRFEWRRAVTEAISLALLANRRGVILYLELGDTRIPLHWSADLRAALLAPGAAIPLCLVRGPEAVLPLPSRGGLAALDRWDDRARWNDDHTAIPTAAALGQRWHALDSYFLEPAFDRAHPERAPGLLPRHQDDFERVAHQDLTGPQSRGWLRPSPWPERSIGRLMGEGDLLLVNGRLDADAVATYLLRA